MLARPCPAALEILLVFTGPWTQADHRPEVDASQDQVVVTCPSLRRARLLRQKVGDDRPVLLRVAVIDSHEHVDHCVSVLESPRSVASLIADVARLRIADGFILNCKRPADVNYRAQIAAHLATNSLAVRMFDALETNT